MSQILGVTQRNQLRNDMIHQWCMEQHTVGKWIQWNHLWWFRHVCRMDNSGFPKQLLRA